MSYYAADRINLIKEVSILKLDLPQDFKLSIGSSERGVKFDKSKYEKIKSAICNMTLGIPIFGQLAWKSINNEVRLAPRQNAAGHLQQAQVSP